MAALVLGLLLLIIPEGTEKPQTDNAYTQDYKALLESQTEKLIERLSGVSDCKVIITFESGTEYVYASDQTLTRTYDGNGVLLSSSTGKEYVLDGNGLPIIIAQTPPKIEGIGVVAANAGEDTKYKIERLLKAVYGIPSDRISVES